MSFAITIRHKLMLLGLCSFLSLLGIAVASYWGDQHVLSANQHLSHMNELDNANTDLRVSRLELLMARYRLLYLYSRKQVNDGAVDAVKQSHYVMEDAVRRLRTIGGSDLPPQLLDDMGAHSQGVLSFSMRTFVASKAPMDLIDKAWNENSSYREKLEQDLKSIDDIVNTTITATYDHAGNTIHDVRIVLLVSFSLSVVALGIFLTLLIRSITRPLHNATEVAIALANGNYKIDIEGVDKHDETGQLARALNKIKTTIADYSGQIHAISKSQAVAEFSLDGHLLAANSNFLAMTGYTLDEVKRQHHRMFVDAATQQSSDYMAFWDALTNGQHQAGEFKRLAKNGTPIWVQASYNPIYDPYGNPSKWSNMPPTLPPWF